MDTPATTPSTPAGPSGPASRHAVIVQRSDLTTVFIALDIAADHDRDRAEMCNCCADQSCPDCHTHQRRAAAYDQVADRLHRDAESALDAHRGQSGRHGLPQPSSLAADKEAGQ
jgi:hypothetical protein